MRIARERKEAMAIIKRWRYRGEDGGGYVRVHISSGGKEIQFYCLYSTPHGRRPINSIEIRRKIERHWNESGTASPSIPPNVSPGPEPPRA